MNDSGISGFGFYGSYIIASLGPSTLSIFMFEVYIITQVALSPLFAQMCDFGSPTRKWITVGFNLIAAVGMLVSACSKYVSYLTLPEQK